MATVLEPAELVGRLRRDVGRNVLRARNGLKYVGGVDRPKVGRTPKDVVWQRDKAQLWRYKSTGVTTATPVLIIMSLISRSYILDLYPGASFIEKLRDAGFDVYLLDWGVPDEADSENGLVDYVEHYLPRAVEAVCDESDSPDVNLIGYCYGGLLSLLLGAARPELPVRSLVTMATPVDFEHMGMFRQVLDRFEPDDVIDDTGNVPPDVMRNAFRVLKPTADVAQYAVLWEKLWDDRQMEGFQAMGQWTREHIPFPGKAFRETVELMRTEALTGDRIRLGGRRVSLRDVTWPLLNIVATKDHIVPAACALPVADLVGSKESQTLELPAGHVGLVMGKAAATTTMPRILEWLHAHSDPVDVDQEEQA